MGSTLAGRVVGYAGFYPSGYAKAFLYSNGSMQNLGTLGGLASTANAINNGGQVVGWANTSNGDQHAFLYSNGLMQDLGTLGGNSSIATGINNSGQVVGQAETGGIDNSNGRYIQHAFLYSNGSLKDLGTLSGLDTTATAINDKGQVVGWGDTGNGDDHAFLYSNGHMQDLGTLYSTPDPFSYAQSINDNGQVVGYASGSDGGSHVAFLYSNGSMQNLNSLIAPNSGWTLYDAFAISDNGQIAVQGVSSNGQEADALILTPIVPEPSSLIAWTGLCAMGRACKVFCVRSVVWG